MREEIFEALETMKTLEETRAKEPPESAPKRQDWNPWLALEAGMRTGYNWRGQRQG